MEESLSSPVEVLQMIRDLLQDARTQRERTAYRLACDGINRWPEYYPDEYRWTVPELAARCKVDETTIWRQIWAGKLGCVQIGKSVRVPEKEYQRFLKGELPIRAYVRVSEQSKLDESA
jgi:Helix-turn-helix domain